MCQLYSNSQSFVSFQPTEGCNDSEKLNEAVVESWFNDISKLLHKQPLKDTNWCLLHPLQVF